MKTYDNDEQMIDELYKVVNYIYTKYNADSYVGNLCVDLEETIIKIREEINE